MDYLRVDDMHELFGPAYRVETERLRLRCLTPQDVDLVDLGIAESLEHLRPWLTWTVHEPLDREERLTWLRTQRGHFDLGSDYCYGLFDKAETALRGVGLLRMASNVFEREVGYWIHPGHLRQGLASEAVAALVRVSFDIEQVEALEIRTFTHNLPSAAIAQRLGFSGPVVDPLSYPMPNREKVDLHVYSLSRVEYASSPARTLPLEAYDALDRRIL